MYTVTLTFQPDKTVIVSDYEFRDLYAQRLILTYAYGGNPDAPDFTYVFQQPNVDFVGRVEVSENLNVVGPATLHGGAIVDTDKGLTVTGATPTVPAIDVKVVGDTAPRKRVYNNGLTEWTSGSGSIVANLYSTSAGLKSDYGITSQALEVTGYARVNTLDVTGNLTVTGNIVGSITNSSSTFLGTSKIVGTLGFAGNAGDAVDASITRTAASSLRVNAALRANAFNTDSTARSAFFKTTSPTEHTMTVYQASTTGLDTGAALNVVSDNSESSTMYLSGTEKNRGTLKIAHKGYADGSDGGASTISIDLQTSGSATRGFYLFSSTGGTTGDPITVRLNGREDFALKASGDLGLGIPTSVTPSGRLDIRQTDTANVGLNIQANADAGANMIQLKTADGTVRTRIDSQGQFLSSRVAYYTGNGVIIGGTSQAVLGGGTGGMLGFANRGTAPAGTPTAGGVMYVENGSLKFKGSSGTITTIAPA